MIGPTAAKKAFDRRERRLESRPAAATFDRLEQTSLFAADVRARATVEVAVDGELALAVHQPLLAEDALGVSLLDRLLDDLGLVVVLAANEEVRGIELTGVARDRDALEDDVRVVVAEQPILEGSGLGLVAVDGEVAATAVHGRKERPLEAAGKTRAATAAQIRVLNEVDDVGGRHVERLLERLVAASGDELVDPHGLAGLGVAPRKGGDALGQDGFSDGHGGIRLSALRVVVLAVVLLAVVLLAVVLTYGVEDDFINRGSAVDVVSAPHFLHFSADLTRLRIGRFLRRRLRLLLLVEPFHDAAEEPLEILHQRWLVIPATVAAGNGHQ